MNAFVRSAARRTSIGLGALALAVGAAACGGGDGQEPVPEQDPVVEETTAEDGEQLEPSDGGEQPTDAGGQADGDSEASDAGGQADGDSEASDAGGETGGGSEASDAGGETGGGSEASDADGEADGDADGDAEELSEQDIEAAKQRWVEFMHAIDDGDGETACGFLLHPETGQTGDEDPECSEQFSQMVAPQVEGGEYGELDSSMVDAEDNGDGTVTIVLDGEPFPLVMSQGEDGQWYATANV